MIDTADIGNVIVRLPNWIGDGVMAIPTVNCIKARFPEWRVTCLGKPAVNALYRNNVNVDKLIDLELQSDRDRLSAIKRFAKDLREYGFDLGLILPDSFSSALIFRLGGIRRRVGYRSELRAFMLTDPIAKPHELIHRSQRYLNLIRQSLGVHDCDESVAIPASGEHADRADRFLDGVDKFAVVCPTSRAPSRRWGDARYTELIKRLAGDMSMGVVLAGSGDESDLVAQIGRASGIDCLNLAEQNDILLSVEVMRRSEVFVGNDSGAAHLAAASGTRVVSISGADDPRETRPLASRSRIVNKQIECSPCVKNVCPRKDHVNECMDVISVDDVMNAAIELLNES